MFDDLPKTRAECNELGGKYYFTGKTCTRGHVDKRNKQGRCMSCLKETNAARDQSTGAKIGRPKGSKNKGAGTAQARRREKRAAAREATRVNRELRKEFKRLELEAAKVAKEEQKIEDEKYVHAVLGNTIYYTDSCSNKLAILYESPDGFSTHCIHKSLEHSYDLQRAAGKLDRVFTDGSTTARRLPKGDTCQYTREQKYHCIYCQKDQHPNSLTLIYDYTEKKYIPSLGRSI